MLRKYPQLVTPRHIRVLEAQLSSWLGNASRVSAKDPSAVSFLKLGQNKPIPVTELDGSPCRDIYTLLNVTPFFTEDQVFNIQAFSALHAWIYYVHIRQLEVPAGLIKGPETIKAPPTKQEPEPPEDPEEKPPQSVIDDTFKRTSVSYCIRIIDQAKLDQSQPNPNMAGSDANAPFGVANFEILTVIEAIRTIHLLCLLDRSTVPQVFGTFKKLSATVNRFLSTENRDTFDPSRSQTLGQLVIRFIRILYSPWRNHGL